MSINNKIVDSLRKCKEALNQRFIELNLDIR